MNKEDILLKNFSILSKNIVENRDALKSAITQLFSINHKLGLRCWEEIINAHINDLTNCINGNEYDYNTVARVIITDFEYEIVGQDNFAKATLDFAKSKRLLEILYTQSLIDEYSQIHLALSYLIRNEYFQEADNILSAIYKNKTFNMYSKLWEEITDRFDSDDNNDYNPGCRFTKSNYYQPKSVQDFCMNWIERIKDETQRTCALTFAMRMFEDDNDDD